MPQTDPAVELSIQLLRQLDATNSQEAFWMVSIVAKLSVARPAMTMRELGALVRQQMPRTVQVYYDYTKST
ncbi:MAG: hypothetical protein KKB13_00165 [Chloroflexi bacterium]|nr:hypothetical protein [Chloroflexota bacterium]